MSPRGQRIGCVFLFLLKIQGPTPQGLREHSKRKLIHVCPLEGRADLVTILCHLHTVSFCSKGCPVLQSLPSLPWDVVFPFLLLFPGQLIITLSSSTRKLLQSASILSAALFPIAVWLWGRVGVGWGGRGEQMDGQRHTNLLWISLTPMIPILSSSFLSRQGLTV